VASFCLGRQRSQADPVSGQSGSVAPHLCDRGSATDHRELAFIRLLALRQPVAVDLRDILSALRITNQSSACSCGPRASGSSRSPIALSGHDHRVPHGREAENVSYERPRSPFLGAPVQGGWNERTFSEETAREVDCQPSLREGKCGNESAPGAARARRPVSSREGDADRSRS
jgi:hypothetical protein